LTEDHNESVCICVCVQAGISTAINQGSRTRAADTSLVLFKQVQVLDRGTCGGGSQTYGGF